MPLPKPSRQPPDIFHGSNERTFGEVGGWFRLKFLSGNTGDVRRFSLDKGRQLLGVGIVSRFVVVRFFGREEGFPASHRYYVPLGDKRFTAEVEDDFRGVILMCREELKKIKGV